MKALLFTFCLSSCCCNTLANQNDSYIDYFWSSFIYVTEKVKTDLFVGITCGLTLDHPISNEVLIILNPEEYFDAVRKYNESNLDVCFPEDRSLTTKLLNNCDKFIKSHTSLSIRLFFVNVILTGSIFLLLKYGKSPYGGSLTIYEMIKQSDSFSNFLNMLKKMPEPSLKECIIGGVIEEIQFRLLLQSTLYYLAKYITNLFYSHEEFPEEFYFIFSTSVSALAFGLAHLVNPNPQLFQVIFAGIAGLYLGSIFYSNGIISSATCHPVINVSIITVKTLMLQALSIIPEAIRWYSYYSLPYPVQETSKEASHTYVF